MRSAKGTLMIDALLALTIILILISVTYGFTQAYYKFYTITEKIGEMNEEEPGLTFD